MKFGGRLGEVEGMGQRYEDTSDSRRITWGPYWDVEAGAAACDCRKGVPWDVPEANSF